MAVDADRPVGALGFAVLLQDVVKFLLRHQARRPVAGQLPREREPRRVDESFVRTARGDARGDVIGAHLCALVVVGNVPPRQREARVRVIAGDTLVSALVEPAEADELAELGGSTRADDGPTIAARVVVWWAVPRIDLVLDVLVIFEPAAIVQLVRACECDMMAFRP